VHGRVPHPLQFKGAGFDFDVSSPTHLPPPIRINPHVNSILLTTRKHCGILLLFRAGQTGVAALLQLNRSPPQLEIR
jgi:hypothetical protein